METTSKLTAFYNQCIDKETAVLTTDDLKNKLLSVPDFDWDEFNKPIMEMDIKKLVEQLKDTGLGGKWKTPVAKGAKPIKSAISKYTLDKSNVMGIGSGWSGSALLIKGLKSNFASHPYKFGTQEELDLLQENISSIAERRKEYQTATEKSDNQDPCYNKKMCSIQVELQICSAEQQFQQSETIEQLKYVYLMQHLIAYQIVREASGNSPRDNKTIMTVKGCIQPKYDQNLSTDIMKASVNVDAIPIYHNSKPCQVVQIQDPNKEYDESEPLYTIPDLTCVSQWVSALQRQNLDLLIVLDSCAVKKQGREFQVMPKFKAVQVVIKKENTYTKKHIGLKLLKQ